LSSSSSALSILVFFVLLPYSKPASHPGLKFQLDYFLRAWLGGPWQGLALLVGVAAVMLLIQRNTICPQVRPALLMPGLFSLIFAGMLTLSRGGFGLEQADASRYITHTLMLGLSALLALALAGDSSRSGEVPLLGAFLVLITGMGSFPQRFSTQGNTYTQAWEQAQSWAEEKRERFVCHAQQSVLAKQGIQLQQPCQWIHPRQWMLTSYFEGRAPIRPMGWHRSLLQVRLANPSKTRSSPAIHFHIDKNRLESNNLEVSGWAFPRANPEDLLYVVADYGPRERWAVAVNQTRSDVQRAFSLNTSRLGFKASLPRISNGQPLQAVLIAGPNQSVQIWEDPSAND
jgi:hypothetical protein